MDNLKHVVSNKSVYNANKVKYYNELDSAVKGMKVKSKQMEKENFLMEQKLSNLKERLKGEIDARRLSGGPRWQSSQSDQSTKRPQYTSVKVLRDEPLESYMARPPDQKKKEARPHQQQTKQNKKSSSSSHHNFIISKKVTRPSQMSENSSSNIAMSPQPPSKPKHQSTTINHNVSSIGIENHGRSDSNAHSTTTDKNSSNPLLAGEYDEKANANSFQEALNEWRNSDTSTTTDSATNNDNNNNNPLLDGVYNEKESAQSFQDALKEWRTGGDTSTMTNRAQQRPKVHRSGTSVSVQSRQSTSDLSDIENKIKFGSSLSYMEKLMLKKHRQDSIFNYSLPRPKSAVTQNEFNKEQNKNNDINTTDLVTTRSEGHSCVIDHATATRPTTAERNWRNRYDGMGGYFEIGTDENSPEEYHVDEPVLRNPDSPDIISEQISDANDLNYYSDGYWRPSSSYEKSR